jgi:hypothetical protein
VEYRGFYTVSKLTFQLIYVVTSSIHFASPCLSRLFYINRTCRSGRSPERKRCGATSVPPWTLAIRSGTATCFHPVQHVIGRSGRNLNNGGKQTVHGPCEVQTASPPGTNDPFQGVRFCQISVKSDGLAPRKGLHRAIWLATLATIQQSALHASLRLARNASLRPRRSIALNCSTRLKTTNWNNSPSLSVTCTTPG